METVITSEGKEINIKGFQNSLHEWPMRFQAAMTDDGEPYLRGNCVYKHNPCGCEITGNGTLQFPLGIKFCEKHSKI